MKSYTKRRSSRKRIKKFRSEKRSRKFGNEDKLVISDFESKHKGIDFDKINKNLDSMINTFIKMESTFYKKEDLDVIINFFNENLRPILHAGIINNEVFPKDTLNYVMEKYYPNNKNRHPKIPTSKFNFFVNNPLTSFRLLRIGSKINSPSYGPNVEWCKKIKKE
jgi:hypothetical protein